MASASSSALAASIKASEASAVVVLDEAMSAVDQHTEGLMVRVLEEEFAGHTVVSVVHRLNTVRNADRIVVLDAGRKIADGPPDAIARDPAVVAAYLGD